MALDSVEHEEGVDADAAGGSLGLPGTLRTGQGSDDGGDDIEGPDERSGGVVEVESVEVVVNKQVGERLALPEGSGKTIGAVAGDEFGRVKSVG